MKECSYCGTKYPEDALSCPGCGANAVVPEPEKKVWQKMMDYGTSRYGTTKQPECPDAAEKGMVSEKKSGVGRLVGCVVLIATIVLFARAWINNHGPEAEARAAQEKLMKQQYKTAKEYIKDKEYELALDTLAKIPADYEDYDDVLEARGKASKGYAKEVIVKVDEYVEGGNFYEAMAILNLAVEKTASYEKLVTKRDEVFKQCETLYIKEAEEYVQTGDYELAVKRIEGFIENIGPSEAVEEKRIEYRKNIIHNKVQGYENEKKYAEGITYLQSQLISVGRDEALETKYDELCSTYKKLCLSAADDYEGKKDYANAIKTLDEYVGVVGEDPEFEDRKWEIKRAAAIDKADEYVQNGKFAEGIKYIKKQSALVKEDVKVTGRYTLLCNLYKRECFEQSLEYSDEKKYDEAINVLKKYMQVVGEDSDATEKIMEYNSEQITSELKKYDRTSDYAGAIGYLKTVKVESGNDNFVAAKLLEYKGSYKEELFTKAQTAYTANGYSSAVDVLNEASAVLGYDSDVSSKISYYAARKPQPLSSLKPYYGKLTYCDKTLTDLAGNSYPEYFCDIGKGTVLYYLNKEYRTFQCKYVLRSVNSFDRRELTITNDDTGEVLFSGSLGEKSVDGLNVNIDVSQVTFLRITIEDGGGTRTGLVNAQLVKK